MSQLFTVLDVLWTDPSGTVASLDTLAGPGDGVIPEYKPEVPGPLEKVTSTILGWMAGGGLALAVVGGLAGWALVGIGHNTERAQLASRGKQGILWSLIAGGGIAVTSGLIIGFYNMVA